MYELTGLKKFKDNILIAITVKLKLMQRDATGGVSGERQNKKLSLHKDISFYISEGYKLYNASNFKENKHRRRSTYHVKSNSDRKIIARVAAKSNRMQRVNTYFISTTCYNVIFLT